VVQSARGELALVNVDAQTLATQLADLNHLVPGFNFLPVGRLPEHVRASQDGCIAVTSTTDSCDLSVVKVPILYNLANDVGRRNTADAGVGTIAPGCAGGYVEPLDYGTDVVARVQPQVRGVPLGGRPAWIEIAPETDAVHPIYGDQPGGIPGTCQRGSYYAWVALPGCGRVVEIAIANAVDPTTNAVIQPGKVVRALRSTQAGAEPCGITAGFPASSESLRALRVPSRDRTRLAPSRAPRPSRPSTSTSAPPLLPPASFRRRPAPTALHDSAAASPRSVSIGAPNGTIPSDSNRARHNTLGLSLRSHAIPPHAPPAAPLSSHSSCPPACPLQLTQGSTGSAQRIQ
jgi:hypothetical protein